MIKNNDIDEYKHFEYSIGFDRKRTFVVGIGFGRKCIIFGIDMSSSVHNRFSRTLRFCVFTHYTYLLSLLYCTFLRISSVHVDNKKKKFLGEGPKQGLDGTTLTAEKKYSINFTESKEKICLSLHYNGANSCLFVNGTKIIKFKANDSQIVATALCLGNISKKFSVYNTRKTGSNGYAFDFSADHDAITVDDILDIQKYLMKNKDFMYNF